MFVLFIEYIVCVLYFTQPFNLIVDLCLTFHQDFKEARLINCKPAGKLPLHGQYFTEEP